MTNSYISSFLSLSFCPPFPRQNKPNGGEPIDDAVNVLNVSVEIPSAKAAQVIGKGGSAVKAMNERTSCRIRVDQDAYQQFTKKVLICGKTDGVVKAIELVLRIVSDGPDFLVDSAMLSAIQGGGGSSSDGDGGAAASSSVTDDNSGEYKSIVILA